MNLLNTKDFVDAMLVIYSRISLMKLKYYITKVLSFNRDQATSEFEAK